jgi:hypothetical protein
MRCRGASFPRGRVVVGLHRIQFGASAGELGANKFDLFLQYLPPSAATPDADGYRYILRAMAKKAIGFTLFRVAVIGFLFVKFCDQ